jgi:hypothetical protein
MKDIERYLSLWRPESFLPGAEYRGHTADCPRVKVIELLAELEDE